MIYTVTLNPAIDYVVHTGKMRLGEVNRSAGEEMYFGGKGINVSLVLKELGIPSTALGFVAGFTGDAIEREMADAGVATDFVKLKKGNSRINIKIKSTEETDLNGSGPDIEADELNAFFDKLKSIKDGDTIILAGSIPGSLPSNVYEKILEKLSDRNVRVVVDATKELLFGVLKFHPFLVKPNHHELGEMFDTEISTKVEAEIYAKKLQEMGAGNVLVSMAGEGAVLLDENGKTHRCGVCKGTVKNSVGAGDSMVAGFVAGLLKKEQTPDFEYALQLGTAAGGATAFSGGLATREKIEEKIKELQQL